MKSIQETASMLREMADKLDEQTKKTMIEPERTGVDIQLAAHQLRALLGEDEYFSIRVDFNFHSHSKPNVQWQIYDGNKSHDAPTLQAAMEKVIAKNRKVEPLPVEADATAVSEALDPLPL